MISPNYFDYAAATPLSPKVLAAMIPYYGDLFYNPSAEYLAAKRVATDIKSARYKLASCLGVRPPEIVFTAGGTEANNLAINGIMQQYPDAEVLVSAIEHDSVITPAANYRNKLIPVNELGYVDVSSLEKLVTPRTVLISVMYANNEVGTIQPVKELSEVVKRIQSERLKSGNTLPLYLHTDASQAGNYLSLKVSSLGVDLMTINGGKIYGPKQSGALWIRTGVELKPQILGGGQENGQRSGTENVASIIGLAEAVDIVQTKRISEVKRLQKLQDKFTDELTQKMPFVIINGGKKRLPNNVHVTIPGIDNELVMMRLDEAGFQVAVGSACSASSDEPSHVLSAMGLGEPSIRSSLRFSMGRFTTAESVQNLVSALVKACG